MATVSSKFDLHACHELASVAESGVTVLFGLSLVSVDAASAATRSLRRSSVVGAVMVGQARSVSKKGERKCCAPSLVALVSVNLSGRVVKRLFGAGAPT